jgi:hypothetical protein
MTSNESQNLLDSRGFECPACTENTTTKSSIAIVSPWVAELSETSNIKTPKYFVCSSCGTGWFAIWYSDNVLDALYKAYRGDEYFKVRNSWEPSYTTELNSGLNHGEMWLDGRRKQIEKSIVDAGFNPGGMLSVLDFGGGHGGVMPRFPQRYLLEANESVQPEPGVIHIRKWEDAKSLHLDLVMCCGVLEHLNDPSELVSTILELNSSLYLFEVPTGTPIHRKGLVRLPWFLRFVASKKFIWSRIQTIERKAKPQYRKYFPLRCSEHLQFFTPLGLESLLTRCGLEVIELSQTSPNESLANAKNLGFETGLIAVCRKRAEL